MFPFLSLICLTRLGQASIPNSDLDKLILGLRVTSGSWAGTYVQVHQNSPGFRWYFVTEGLRGIADRDQHFGIESLLNQYLAHLDKHMLIDDVPDISVLATVPADSDDTYAASFILLCLSISNSRAGSQWLMDNLARVKAVAKTVLLENQLTTGPSRGLIPTFSKHRTHFPPDVLHTPFCYLEDSCENYAALSKLGTFLRSVKDSDAANYEEAAAHLARAIERFFSPKDSAFYVLDGQIGGPWLEPKNVKFYPGRASQVFPELFGVPLGSPKRTRELYNAGWAFLNANHDRWYQEPPTDGSTGGFPWMILGVVAQMRHETAIVNKQIAWFDRELTAGAKQNLFGQIQELGFRRFLTK